jgi:diguanylate cyclase (GGDEF)-like protein
MTAPRQRLSTRIVALFLGLLLLVQLAGFAAIRASMEASARASLAQELQVGERIWRRLLAQKVQSLTQGSTLLAADFGFRSAVASADDDTLHSALENHAARIGAGASAWVGNDLRVRAVGLDGGAAAEADRLGEAALALVRRNRSAQVVPIGGRAMQLVAVPLKAPLTLGWLVLGFPLDQALAQDMKALSGLDLALLLPAADGRLRPNVATLPGADAVAWEALQEDRLLLGGHLLQTRAVALGPDDAPQARVLLLQSVDAALAPMRRLQWTLALITAVGVAVFAVGSVITARRVTTPLSALASAADRLGRGDYAQPLPHTGRADEIGKLADAFDQMRVSIAGQQAEIHDLAFRDRLTALPNRPSLRAALQAQLARGGPGAVLMFGLDRFKHVNDVLGYAFGDRLLQAVGQRLAGHAVRGDDLIARLGGDEFALLLPGSDGVRAQEVAARLERALAQPLLLGEQTVDVSASFGIACWPAHGADADTLLARAEVAMYAAKRKTMTCLVYDPAIDSSSAQTLSLLGELRRALEQQELRLFLQPKIELHSGAFVAAEALVRWQHPQRGMVPPLHFIPFAEQTGFVRALTLWMFEACAREWPRLQPLGVRRLSVNLSTRDLMDVELPQRLQQILDRHGVPATAFCLEITESAIMDEPQRALETLHALSAAGYRLSIDDFGTGYSSLAYLKRLPVDELKIDKSFVIAMERDLDDAKIVRSTIDLAHNLGLTVVAEGIENAHVYGLLRALGCDEGQGFHLSRPLPAAEIAEFARRWQGAESPQPAAAAHA